MKYTVDLPFPFTVEKDLSFHGRFYYLGIWTPDALAKMSGFKFLEGSFIFGMEDGIFIIGMRACDRNGIELDLADPMLWYYDPEHHDLGQVGDLGMMAYVTYVLRPDLVPDYQHAGTIYHFAKDAGIWYQSGGTMYMSNQNYGDLEVLPLGDGLISMFGRLASVYQGPPGKGLDIIRFRDSSGRKAIIEDRVGSCLLYRYVDEDGYQYDLSGPQFWHLFSGWKRDPLMPGLESR